MSITKQKQHGFSMVEVLIAAFVLAVGLLGLASLQVQGLQFNFSAYQRSQANILAYDILDRMRANPTQVMASSYNQGLGVGPTTNTDCQAAGANCTSADMAAFDITQWECSLGNWNDNATCQNFGIEGPLAQGDGSVVVNIVGGRAQVTISVTWLDNRTLDDADPNRTETFTVSSVL